MCRFHLPLLHCKPHPPTMCTPALATRGMIVELYIHISKHTLQQVHPTCQPIRRWIVVAHKQRICLLDSTQTPMQTIQCPGLANKQHITALTLLHWPANPHTQPIDCIMLGTNVGTVLVLNMRGQLLYKQLVHDSPLHKVDGFCCNARHTHDTTKCTFTHPSLLHSSTLLHGHRFMWRV